MNMDEAIDKLIGIEGAYSNNPNDSGGETMWGITIDEARRNGYNQPMRSMPRAEAARIYKSKYIIAPKLDKIWTVDQARIAYEVFDTGVNCGPKTAIKMFQKALNALNRQGKDYPDITEDGDIGPKTLQALQKFLQLRKLEGEIVLLKMLNVLQGSYYIDLASRRMKDEE
ncbi:glycosyl hydrolase 108 family protein, partial [Microcystis sp. M26BS1]